MSISKRRIAKFYVTPFPLFHVQSIVPDRAKIVGRPLSTFNILEGTKTFRKMPLSTFNILEEENV